MSLSTIDRLVRKLEPVDALVEKLSERLLPHKVAHADGRCGPYKTICAPSNACGVHVGVPYELCCESPAGVIVSCSCTDHC
jgi:hypothetical protein